MRKRTILYFLLVAVSIYIFFMYDGAIMTGIILLELVYPMVSFFYLRGAGNALDLNMGYVPDMAEKGKKIRTEVILNNRSSFRTVRYRVRMSINNMYSKHNIRQYAKGVIEPGRMEKFYFVFSSEYSGSLKLVVDSLDIYDLLGIFYRRIRIDKKKYIGIMPSFELVPLEITRRTRDFAAEAEEFSGERSGDDPSEIYQVREYRAQDNIHSIHWKMTAKEDKLMVKEQAFPMGCVVLIRLSLLRRDIRGKGVSRLLDAAASLSMTLLEEKCIHMISWFDEKNLKVVKRRVDSEESLYAWIWRLFEAEPYEDKELEELYYKESFLGQYFSSTLVVDAMGNYIIDGEKQEFLRL